jgi:hypothetical protein
MILEIIPNWRKFWTKSEAEKELVNCDCPQLINFAFNGIGWYFDNSGGAMLVSDSSAVRCTTPSCCRTQNQIAEDTNEKRYWFYYWAVSPMTSFNWVANAPVIEDLRK